MSERGRGGDHCKLDRLGRSLADLLDITKQLEAKSVTLRVLDQNLETKTAQGKLMFSMLGPLLSSRQLYARSVRWKGS